MQTAFSLPDLRTEHVAILGERSFGPRLGALLDRYGFGLID